MNRFTNDAKFSIQGLLLLYTPREFFTSELADSLSLTLKGQQVLSLQDSTQYSGRFQ